MQIRKIFDLSTVASAQRLEVRVLYAAVFVPAITLTGLHMLTTIPSPLVLLLAVILFAALMALLKYIGYRRRQLQVRERMARDQARGLAQQQTVFAPSVSQEAPWQASDTKAHTVKQRKEAMHKLLGLASGVVVAGLALTQTTPGALLQNDTFMIIGSVITLVLMIVFVLYGIREIRRIRTVVSLSQPQATPASFAPNTPSNMPVDFSAMRTQPTRLRTSPLAITIWTFGILGLMLTAANDLTLFVVGGVLFAPLIVLMVRRSPIMFSGSHESGLAAFATRNQFVLQGGIDRVFYADIGAILSIDMTQWDDLESGSKQLAGTAHTIPFAILEVSWLPPYQKQYAVTTLLVMPTLREFYDPSARQRFEAVAQATGIMESIDYRTQHTYCKLMTPAIPDDYGTMQRTFGIIAAAAAVRSPAL